MPKELSLERLKKRKNSKAKVSHQEVIKILEGGVDG